MNPAYRSHLILSFLTDGAHVLIWTGFTVFQLTVVAMSPLQLVLVGSVLEITILLCEVPTRVIADLVSRRLSIILGFTLTAIAYLLQAAIPTFPIAVLGAVIWGVSVACISGSPTRCSVASRWRGGPMDCRSARLATARYERPLWLAHCCWRRTSGYCGCDRNPGRSWRLRI